MQYTSTATTSPPWEVWYLECWARARMGDTKGLLQSYAPRGGGRAGKWVVVAWSVLLGEDRDLAATTTNVL